MRCRVRYTVPVRLVIYMLLTASGTLSVISVPSERVPLRITTAYLKCGRLLLSVRYDWSLIAQININHFVARHGGANYDSRPRLLHQSLLSDAINQTQQTNGVYFVISKYIGVVCYYKYAGQLQIICIYIQCIR